jgi:holliday junction DNA helicase RuvB
MSSKLPKEKSSPKESPGASFLDNELRPSRWQDYIGQKTVKDNLRILIQAATERGVPPEHVLFYGPPGLGKTTLAHLVAKETGRAIKITSGPAIERVGDLASILTNLTSGDILFIDEIHRLNKTIEEVLYPAMESGVLDIIIGKGPSARTIQLELPPFTLLAATTRVAMISSPLRSRFSGGIFRLEFYNEDEIEEILRRSAKIIGVKIEDQAEREIAKRSRFTPRTANYFLKRARDFAQVEGKPLNKEVVKLALKLLGIDEKGLSPSDRKLLEIMADKFAGGPVGLSTLAAALSEEEATIEEFNEPYLLQLGLIERTARGRALTTHAYKHLGKTPPANLQKKLL